MRVRGNLVVDGVLSDASGAVDTVPSVQYEGPYTHSQSAASEEDHATLSGVDIAGADGSVEFWFLAKAYVENTNGNHTSTMRLYVGTNGTSSDSITDKAGGGGSSSPRAETCVCSVVVTPGNGHKVGLSFESDRNDTEWEQITLTILKVQTV